MGDSGWQRSRRDTAGTDLQFGPLALIIHMDMRRFMIEQIYVDAGARNTSHDGHTGAIRADGSYSLPGLRETPFLWAGEPRGIATYTVHRRRLSSSTGIGGLTPTHKGRP
jgi:hypothetical protein